MVFPSLNDSTRKSPAFKSAKCIFIECPNCHHSPHTCTHLYYTVRCVCVCVNVSVRFGIIIDGTQNRERVGREREKEPMALLCELSGCIFDNFALAFAHIYLYVDVRVAIVETRISIYRYKCVLKTTASDIFEAWASIDQKCGTNEIKRK